MCERLETTMPVCELCQSTCFPLSIKLSIKEIRVWGVAKKRNNHRKWIKYFLKTG